MKMEINKEEKNVIWKILLNINLKRMGMNDEILRK